MRISEAPSAEGAGRAELTYAQAWAGGQPGALAAFRAWSECHLAAPDAAARAALEPDGVALARARRPEMRALIQADPARALALTVPAAVRRVLPAAVLAELETRGAGRGDFEQTIACEPPAGGRSGAEIKRSVVLAGFAYRAHVYGRRAEQATKLGASLHGIALDRDLALHESPVRAPEAGEGAGSAGAGEAFGRIWAFADAEAAEAFTRGLIAAEAAAAPTVPGGPTIAAEPTNSRTIGPQRVLVIRADFPDFQGAAVSAGEAQARMEGTVRAFFEDASYGRTTFTTTVSAGVYRLPQTGAAYAVADNEAQLHTDARARAAADFTLADYDRIMVVFPNIGTSRVPGSLVTFAIGNAASRDATLLATLAPGGYTVQVSGANSASGLTLVEVYEVP